MERRRKQFVVKKRFALKTSSFDPSTTLEFVETTAMKLMLIAFLAAVSTSFNLVPTTSIRSSLLAIPLRPGSTVAIVTPMGETTNPRSFTYKEPLALDDFGTLLRFHVDSGTDGLCVLGTTGEAAQMTMDERASVIRKAVEVAGGKIPIMIGTGTSNPVDCLEQTLQAKELGADAALVVTPMYVKPTQSQLVDHFLTLADTVDFPIVLYNVPGRTGIDMVPETVQKLCKHKNIVGIKEATGDVSRAKTLRDLCGPDFLLYSGDDETGWDFVLQGGDGVVSVTSNILPDVQKAIMAAANSGDRDTVVKLNTPLMPLHDKLFCQSNPIVPKWALKRIGKISTSNLRRPLESLESEYETIVDEAMRGAGIKF